MLEIGTRVDTEKGKGSVAYYGNTEFAEGIWVGVILDEPNGKNNGTVKGVKYFECETNYGVFIKATQVKVESKSRTHNLSSSNLRIPAGSRKDAKNKPLGGSPRMTPTSSTEKLKGSNSNIPGLLFKRQSPKDERKTLTHSQSVAETVPVASVQSSTEAVKTPSSPDVVKEMVKKMEESTLSVPLVLPPDMEQSSELEWLRIQYKDLSEKLESLRLKRKEDRAKLVEFERNRIQLQSLLEYKATMTEAHTQLQRKLQEKEKEMRDILNAKQIELEGVSDIKELLEIVTLDKEMAEEKAEMLQGEIDSQKEKMQELESELSLLKAEMEQGSGMPSEYNSVQVKQLEQQNEKLREALVKMRDITGQMVSDKEDAVLENERLTNELADLLKLCEKLKKNSENAEETIAELKEQVDAAMGSEKMIEKLTEKNLDMEEKIRFLEETIEDFEALRNMDEEILETQREAEKDLRQELDVAFARISELMQQIKSCGVQAEDAERTIIKFRKKVCELNEEIQEHKDQILRLEDEIKRFEQGDSLKLNRVNLITSSRAFAEIVEGELNSLELEFSLQSANYLKAFLPENFTKPGGDNDSLILNVLFPRVAKKASLFSKLLNQKYQQVPGGMRREHVIKSHKAEQWAFCAKFGYLLKSLEYILQKFQSAIEICSVERLARLSQLQIDMSSHEKMLDQYFEYLRTNRIDENTSTEALEKGINHFKNIFAVHMASETFDASTALNNFISQVVLGLSWIRCNAQRINFFLLPEQEEGEVSNFVTSIMCILSECEQLCIRSKNYIPSGKNVLLNSEVEVQLSSAIDNLEKAAKIMNSVCSIASTQLSMLPDVEGFDTNRIKEILQGSVEKIHGQTDGIKSQEYLRKHLIAIRDVFIYFANVLEKGDLEVEKPVKKPFPPLLDRAHARKQDAVEAEGLRWQIEKKDNEIIELKKSIRAKNDDISNYRLRLEMADKKVENSGKADESRLRMLQSRCDELQSELKKAKAEFNETMDALQRDLELSEEENKQLKERIKTMSKKALLTNLSSTLNQSGSVSSLAGNPGHMCSHMSEISYLETELAERNQALKWAEQVIRNLKAQQTMDIFRRMDPLSVPTDICGPLTLSSKKNMEEEDLEKLLREAETLKLECRKYQLPYIVDLCKPKRTQHQEEQSYLTQINSINTRIDQLRFRFQRFWLKYHRTDDMPTILVQHSPKIQEKEAIHDLSDGIYCERFRTACNKLFGNLEAERAVFEAKRKARIACDSRAI